MMSVIEHYWGKARPANPDGPTFHPLVYHALDVAAVMAALLREWPWASARLASASGFTREGARRWAIVAAALHDLGKFADAFQAKAEPWTGRAAWGIRPIPRSFDHGAFGELLWHEAPARAKLDKRTRRRADRWTYAAGGHHGGPTRWPGTPAAQLIRPEAIADAHTFADTVFTLFAPPTAGAASADTHPPTETWLVAGLTVIADWIGSNQRWFPYREPTRDPASYWRRIARPAARRAVRESGLAAAAPAGALALAALTGRPDDATPLQRWAATVALPPGPAIAVIEDLTGAGKTEAALLLAHRMMAAGKARGLYWALPTQATANMLHERLKPTGARLGYRGLFAPNAFPSLALAHGGVDIADGFLTTVLAPDAPTPGDAEPDAAGVPTATAQCAWWLADERRKSLLAHVGVGTIDQALMAALPRRFAQLRQAALAGHVLVVDEVHAYDPYVARTLEALLEGHARLGGSAILVSATLATADKQRFLDAFAQGAGHARLALSDHRFPLATLAGASGTAAAPIAAVRGSRRDLPVRPVASVEEAAALAAEHARAGRCVAWIRNTVHDARAAHALLRELAPEVPVVLFHARFAACDRADIERRVLAALGPASTASGRAPGGVGLVVVATQVVEQSLDLDFDAMITDLAPLEAIIQRAGRLQRHARGLRPAPELAVLAPPPPGDADWFKRLSRGGAAVYPNHAALWAAWELLRNRGLPLETSDPRALIEDVAEQVENGRVPPALLPTRDAHHATRTAQAGVAGATVLRFDRPFDEAGPWTADDEAPTRLGEPTRLLRLARFENGRLSPWAGGGDWRAWRRSELTVPARRIAAVPEGPWSAAIAAARTDWPRRLDGCLVVPLTPSPNGGHECVAAAPDGREIRPRYDADVGLDWSPASA